MVRPSVFEEKEITFQPTFRDSRRLVVYLLAEELLDLSPRELVGGAAIEAGGDYGEGPGFEDFRQLRLRQGSHEALKAALVVGTRADRSG